MIVASYDSGVTQSLLDKMYLQMIIDSTHDVARELTRLGTQIALLGNELEGDDELGDSALAKALRILESAEEQLRQRRETLAARTNALQNERTKSTNTLRVA